jgi:hypothetical protein
MCDYSEDFLARLDTPILKEFSMSLFLHHSLHYIFRVPHFKQFIGRANGLKPKVARVCFDPCSTYHLS